MISILLIDYIRTRLAFTLISRKCNLVNTNVIFYKQCGVAAKNEIVDYFSIRSPNNARSPSLKVSFANFS